MLLNILVFVFMRTAAAGSGFEMWGSIFKCSSWSVQTGLGAEFFIVFALAIVFTLCSHLIEQKSEKFFDSFTTLKLPVMWAVYLVVIFAVILFGYYGPGYDPIEFIYIGF